MIKAETKKFLGEAFLRSRKAEHELQRPARDAVLFCACRSTREAAELFLRSYLSAAGKPGGKSTLLDLYRRCCESDKHFRAIDLSCFSCGDTLNYDYCLSGNKVGECYNCLLVVRELVMAKLKVTERDLQG